MAQTNDGTLDPSVDYAQVTTPSKADTETITDVANYMALVMRDTREAIVNGHFINGLTPHQYTTQKVLALITTTLTQERDELLAQLPDELPWEEIPAHREWNNGFNEAVDQFKALIKGKDT